MSNSTNKGPKVALQMRVTIEAYEFLDAFASSRGIKLSSAFEIIIREHHKLTEPERRKAHEEQVEAMISRISYQGE